MSARVTSLHRGELYPTPSPLRELRQERGWTLQQLADALYQRCSEQGQPVGINADTVGRWERGKSTPSARYQRHLCALFGVPPERFGFAAPCHPIVPDAPERARRPVLSLETDACRICFQEAGLTIESATFPFPPLHLSHEDTEALLEALTIWKYGQQGAARLQRQAHAQGDRRSG
jgi:transcriptional regulator with XRE-family HTH domain